MNIEELYKLFLQTNSVLIDSRKIQKNDAFFGLNGEQVNGNEYAEKAIELGALFAIVDEEKYKNEAKNIFYVEDSLQCLQDLAKYHRNQLKIPIIGLTGSNGKTTTKELIASVLSQKFNTLYTFGNLNNHIGVPLTILSIKPFHEIAVIEMGANHQKEIEFLCEICQPDFGYITNFGKAHLEGFGGFEGVIKGKTELFTYLKNNNKTAFVNAHDELQLKHSTILNRIIFGEKNTQYYFSSSKNEENKIKIHYQDIEIQSNITGDYNFSNLSIAITMGLYFGITIEKIKLGIENYIPTNHRSQIMELNGKHFVMDAYNANPSSMEAALRNFSTFKGSKTVILGDMFELGEESDIEHQKIADLASDLAFDEIILIGEKFYLVKNSTSKSFKNKADFKNNFDENKINTENILIKGSRGMALETILDWF